MSTPSPIRHKKTPTCLDGPMFGNVTWKERAALLARARQGEPEAIQELWNKFRCRLIRPDAPKENAS